MVDRWETQAVDFVRSILLLYNPSYQNNPNYPTLQHLNFEEANSYLLEFANTSDAWMVSLYVLKDAIDLASGAGGGNYIAAAFGINNSIENISEVLNPGCLRQIQYWAANTLYTKVNRDWRQISSNTGNIIDLLISSIYEILSVYTTANSNLVSFSTNTAGRRNSIADKKVVLDRLILTATALALRMKEDILIHIEQSLSFLTNPEDSGTLILDSTNVDADSAIALTYLGLQLLKLLPEELELGDIAANRKQDAQERLATVTHTVVGIIQQVCVHPSLDYYTTSIGIESFGAWMSIGVLTLSNMYRLDMSSNEINKGVLNTEPHYTDFVNMLVDVVANPDLTPGKPKVLESCCKTLTDIISINEYPRPPERSEIVLHLVNALVQGGRVLLQNHDPNFLNGTNTLFSVNTLHKYASYLVDLCLKEATLICSGIEPTLDLIDVALELTKHPHMNISSMMISLWVDINDDVPDNARHPLLLQPLYGRLLETLCCSCAFSSEILDLLLEDAEIVIKENEDNNNFINDNDLDDNLGQEEGPCEEFVRFRESHLISELAISCFEYLQADYVAILFQTLQEALNLEGASTNLICQQAEVCALLLFLVHRPLSDTVKEIPKKSLQGQTPYVIAGSQIIQTIPQFLYAFLSKENSPLHHPVPLKMYLKLVSVYSYFFLPPQPFLEMMQGLTKDIDLLGTLCEITMWSHRALQSGYPPLQAEGAQCIKQICIQGINNNNMTVVESDQLFSAVTTEPLQMILDSTNKSGDDFQSRLKPLSRQKLNFLKILTEASIRLIISIQNNNSGENAAISQQMLGDYMQLIFSKID